MNNISLKKQIEGCERIRQISIDAISDTVRSLEVGVTTEREALDVLIEKLKSRGIADYWYPAGEASGDSQFGCIVAFDTNIEPQRTAFANARSLVVSDKIKWNETGYFYASPQQVDKDLKMIYWGDFASTVYTGSDDVIKKAFCQSWNLSQRVISALKNFELNTSKEIFERYEKEAKILGVKNAAVSTTAPDVGANAVSMGHTFPNVEILEKNLDSIDRYYLAKQRRFIDGKSENPLEGKIWSFEPRDRSIEYQNGAISFHRLFAIDNKILFQIRDCHDFFIKVGMDWIIK